MICGADYKDMTKRLLEDCELDAHIESNRSRIGIKPNLVSPSDASYGATTHPEVVAGIIEYLQEHGFENLVMLEGSWVGDKTEDSYEVCGFRALSEQYQVPFLDMQKEKGVAVDCAGLMLNVCEAATKLDFLINVPVWKGHCQTKITCALKNMKGLLPNSEKRRFHALGLHRPIAHLNAGIRQDFIVIDNICGDLDFEDGGNPVVRNCIMAACDPVLVDAYVCRLLHYETDDVPYIRLAEQLGVGSADLEQAEIYECARNEQLEWKCVSKTEQPLPKSRKVVELCDAVEEVESCSACYGYLIPALERLKEEGLLEKLDTRICIGQGYQGRTGKLGIGRCTSDFEHNLKGCPPTDHQIYEFLRDYLNKM